MLGVAQVPGAVELVQARDGRADLLADSLAGPSPVWSPRGTLRSAGLSSANRAGVGRGVVVRVVCVHGIGKQLDGEPVPVEQRLAEIPDRYGPGHLVSRSIQCASQ